uniref:Uncharacterized protein n=1 Tax=Acrobeloides nanus TaxID=290746 RepID=A0A914DKS1_9BILA
MAVNRNMHFFQDTVVRGAGKWHDERDQISSKPIDIVLGGHQHDKHSSKMLTNQAEPTSQSSKKASTFKSGLSETIRFFENPSPSNYECSALVKPKMKVSNLKSAAASSEMVPFEKPSREHLNIDLENLTPARPNMVKSGLIINSYHDEICYTKSLAINEQDETNAHSAMKTDLNTSITSTKTSRSIKNTSIRTFHGTFEHTNGDFSGNSKHPNQPTENSSGNSDHDNQWAGNSERSLKPASSLVKTGLVIGDHSKDIYPLKKSEVEAGLGTTSQSSKTASTLHKPTASAQTKGSFSISSGSNLSFGSDRSTQTSPSLVKSNSIIDDHCGDNYFIKKSAFTDQVETTPQPTNEPSNWNTPTASSKTSRFLENSYAGNLCSETQTTPSLPKSSFEVGGQYEEKHYLKKPMMQEQIETTPQATNWSSNWNTTTASSKTSRFLEDSLVENLSISSEAQKTPSLPKSSIEIGGQCEEKKSYFKKPMMQEQKNSAKDTSKWNTSTASSQTNRFFDNTSIGSLSINSKCSTQMSPSLVKSGLIIGGHCEDHYDKKSASEEQTKFGPRVFNLNVVRGGVRDVWKLKAYIAKPDGSKEVVRVADNRDGTINIHYRPNEPGEHHLHILHNNVNMLGSPIDFVVMSENDGHYSVFGDGLKRARVGEPARFTICTGGWLDSRLAIIVEGKSKVHLDRRDNHDGTIDVIWIAEESGEYKISLKLSGQHLKGSPFIAYIST